MSTICSLNKKKVTRAMSRTLYEWKCYALENLLPCVENNTSNVMDSYILLC